MLARFLDDRHRIRLIVIIGLVPMIRDFAARR